MSADTQVMVFRICEAPASQLLAALQATGIHAEMERYGRAVYVVVQSDRDDIATFVAAQVPDAITVLSLDHVTSHSTH